MRRHTGFRPYKCKTCNMTFASSRVLYHHEIAHNKLLQFPCIQCGKYFIKLEYLLKHLHRHFNTKKPVCPICHETCAHNQVLKRHVTLHYNVNPYPCNKCNASFKNAVQLSCHHIRAHGKQKQRFMCGRCGIINVKRKYHVHHVKFECAYTRKMPEEMIKRFKYDTVYMDSHS
uniref:Zinc finger protein 768 n=1 Tax=Cacopsylla melanoneura TaxID=428564 RepID=A0A8D9ACK2_9HEMI